MLRTYARVRPTGDEPVDLVPGDIVGRMEGAALCVADPRMSEAHALVSLRGGDLKLIALRSDLRVGRAPAREVTLRAGITVHLCEGRALTVEEVAVPDELLAIALPGEDPVPLTGSAVAIELENGRLRLAHGPVASHAARLWSTSEGWVIHVGDGPAEPLRPGTTHDVAGQPVRAVTHPAREAASPSTVSTWKRDRLRIVARYDTVHVFDGERMALALGGIKARLVSEVATVGAPVSWEAVARGLWPDEAEHAGLRRRWDVTLARIRRSLREAALPDDLLRADGRSNVELLLRPGDEVVDET